MLTYIVPTVNPYFSIWGIFPIFQLFPQHACFSAASGWGIFPISQLPPQHACFPLASGWGIFPIFQLFPQFTTQTNIKKAADIHRLPQTLVSKKYDHFCNNNY
jgi:hypothetical protein